ncbi:GntR family transcriptional regulator [Sphingomonas crocodyli]|uniref:GntR family transcriptional regulator n=1 Tax=Sphingomonas crocodyli TaxID=1979270 RepID=A0A437LYC1_9SPHN|nr:GntR family transcriptional regulator [Sphingomonas crocodyli]RVT90333.1 GntR family transcriptional regulator [Sphingomonas crocodyli]
MSPAQALARCYAHIKRELLFGEFGPGRRLEATRIADQLGVSITPVRDVLNRLVGEDLVIAKSGDGFHVPWLTQDELHDLYLWNGFVSDLAVRAPSQRSAPSPPSSDSYAARAASFFAGLSVGSRPIEWAMRRNNEWLSRARAVEPDVMDGIDEELNELLAMLEQNDQRNLIAVLRRYHRRRERAADLVIRAMRRRYREEDPAPL